MFELDKYEGRLHTEPPATPTRPYQPAANVKEMSLLFWGEHCVECAAPGCYQTCDLYQARPDKRCRRFVYGSFKNGRFPSMRGYGVEVSFKKWAKIEATGNLAMQPVRSVLARERLVQWIAPLTNAVGKFVGKVTRNSNWESGSYIVGEKWASRQHRRRSRQSFPDAFLIEVYNPTVAAVRLQVNFALSNAENTNLNEFVLPSPSFTTTLSFPTGYSRKEINTSQLHPVVASGKPFKISMIPEGDSRARLVFLTADFVSFIKKPIAATAQKIKCIVWDLDNTLWDGILTEGDDVTVRPEMARLLKEIDQRGILLSIASKNEYVFSWKKLQQLSLSEYFLYPQINWDPKSASIKRIAERLNIGLDSFAFVDDSPFELDQVGRALPEVVCISAENALSLFTDPRFQGSASEEARHRRHFYRDAISREVARQESGCDHVGFLATCGITLEIATYSPEHSERVAELVQRTNQLNFSGHKYTRGELDKVLSEPGLEKYVLKCSDKYGSYGTVGFGIVGRQPGALLVRDFMLSCRVQGKFIEQAFFHHLIQHHNPDAATTLFVNFRPTERNTPAQQVLRSLGFRKSDSLQDGLANGMVQCLLDSLRCDFIDVRCLAPQFQAAKSDWTEKQGNKFSSAEISGNPQQKASISRSI